MDKNKKRVPVAILLAALPALLCLVWLLRIAGAMFMGYSQRMVYMQYNFENDLTWLIVFGVFALAPFVVQHFVKPKAQ